MKNAMRIINVIAFTILLIAGMNYLIAGIFGMDLFAMMFGASISIAGRIIYTIIGLSALLLLITVIARATMKNKSNSSN